jgi:hypothetical protein
MNVRLIVREFRDVCAALLAQQEVSAEFAYRIEKLMDSVAPIDDKMYLKTLKGQESLLQCTEKARLVKEHLACRDVSPYRLLTDLELTCEDLLNTTYEFRIKAG